jgi:hypothetical protein
MNMSEQITTDTLVAGENVLPVNTDADADTQVEAKSDESVTESQSPAIESKEGRLFLDGKRIYTRDDVNSMMDSTIKKHESKLLSDLDVESFDQVKTVVNQLRSASEVAGEGDNNLNVEALRNAVAKREQTVEELKTELQRVKTDYALREHIGILKDNMPANWTPTAKESVVTLMKASDMLQLEGDSFHIKNGSDFLTTDGETPDYKSAVEMVGKNLGLPFAKKGVDTYDAVKQPGQEKVSGVDENRLRTDPEYRKAYVDVRNSNRTATRDSITHQQLQKQMERTRNVDQKLRSGF